jgi:hypothetical protein
MAKPKGPALKCPKCGWSCSDGGGARVVTEPHAGTYCLHCFAGAVFERFAGLNKLDWFTGWVAEHVAKMEVRGPRVH